MADERIARVLLRFEIAKADIDRVKGHFTAFERQFDSFAKSSEASNRALEKQVLAMQRSSIEAAKAAQSYAAAGSATRTLQTELARMERQRALNQAAEDAAKLALKTKDAEGAIKGLTARLREMKATDTEISSAANTFDDLTTAGGRRGRRSNAVTRFGMDVRALPAVPVADNLSTDVFGKLIAVFGSLNPAVLGVTALIGGLVVGLQVLGQEGGRAIQSLINSQEEYYRALKTGSTESIQAAIEAKRIEIDILRARVTEYQNLFKGLEESTLFSVGQIDVAVGGVGRAIADGLNVGNIQTLRKELEELEAKLRDEEFAMSRLTGALGSTDVATNDMEAAEKALAETRAAARDKIATLQRQGAQLEADAQDQALDAFIDRAIAERRANEDLERTLEQQRSANQERLLAIEEAGQERIADIRAAGLKRLGAFDAQTSKLMGSLGDQIIDDNDKLRALNTDFMAAEAKATQKARDDELKRTRDHSSDMLRLLEDRLNAELDAQEGNDVVAFIQAQRRSDQQIKRAQEDFDTETADRSARFLAERQEAQARYQERLTEIEAESQARQQAIRDELAARQAARQDIETEIAAAAAAETARIQEQQAAQQRAFDAQLAADAEVRRIQAERAQEDLDLAEARRKDALDKQLRDINWRIQMEADAASLIVENGQNGARIIGEAHVNMANRVASEITTISQRAQQAVASGAVMMFEQRSNIQWNLPRSTSSGGGGRSMIAFAGGGVADRPTVGLFGERPGYAEAFIPFRKSEGLDQTLARLGVGGPSVNFNAPISVGDGVSQQQVKAAMTEAVMGLLDGLAMARGV